MPKIKGGNSPLQKVKGESIKGSITAILVDRIVIFLVVDIKTDVTIL